MRSSWRLRSKSRNLRLPLAFFAGVVFGGSVEPEKLNRNTPTSLSTEVDSRSLELIIEEGRRQADSQASRFADVQSRAQTLATVTLATLAFAAGGFKRLERVHDGAMVLCSALWISGLVTLVIGLVLAAAVIVVRASFDQIDTTTLTAYPMPIQPSLANDYAHVVILGETTVAARLTVFRLATRFVIWGAILITLTYIVTQ